MCNTQYANKIRVFIVKRSLISYLLAMLWPDIIIKFAIRLHNSTKMAPRTMKECTISNYNYNWNNNSLHLGGGSVICCVLGVSWVPPMCVLGVSWGTLCVSSGVS